MNNKRVLFGYNRIIQPLATCTSQFADFRWGHLK